MYVFVLISHHKKLKKKLLTIMSIKKNKLDKPHKALEADDYYLNEKGLMVFTEQYHRKRGYCCKNTCRHCPWKTREVKS